MRRPGSAQELEAPLGAMVGATLGLLAFMLAFTFGSAAERYDSRRQVLLDEANAIGTAYLRAGMLPQQREEVRRLLRDYVDTRLEAVRSHKIAEGIRRSEQLHDLLWAEAVTLGERNPTSIVVGLFVESLNEVIGIHAKRVTVAVRNRIPVPYGSLFSPSPSLPWPLWAITPACELQPIAGPACRRSHVLRGYRSHRRP